MRTHLHHSPLARIFSSTRIPPMRRVIHIPASYGVVVRVVEFLTSELIIPLGPRLCLGPHSREALPRFAYQCAHTSTTPPSPAYFLPLEYRQCVGSSTYPRRTGLLCA